MNKLYAIAGILVALILGTAIGWMANAAFISAPTVAKGKFEDAPAAGASATLVYGFAANYPPYTQVNETGQVVGFDVDVMDWLAAKYNWTLVKTPWDWGTIDVALLAGDIDIIDSGMTVTAARSAKMWFSIPYDIVVQSVYVPINETRTALQIFNSGDGVSMELGSPPDQYAQKLLDAGYNFRKVTLGSIQLAFEELLNGRVAAFIGPEIWVSNYELTHPEVSSVVKNLGTIGGLKTYSVATREADHWLRNCVNSGLEELMASPKWTELRSKWGFAS